MKYLPLLDASGRTYVFYVEKKTGKQMLGLCRSVYVFVQKKD